MVAVKGMEMPKNCMDCPLAYPRWDFNIGCKCCKAIIGHHEEYGEYKTKRHPDCPLAEIVTCKDCKYCFIDEDGHGYHCEKSDTERIPTCADFYCVHAERRE